MRYEPISMDYCSSTSFVTAMEARAAGLRPGGIGAAVPDRKAVSKFESVYEVPVIHATTLALPVPGSPAPETLEICNLPALFASLIRAETLAETIEEVTARLRSSAPSFAGGDGEIEIVLKAHVLDGSTVHMSVRGGVVSVCFTPATPDAASFIEKNISRLETSLSERIPRFRFSVSARKVKKK